MLNYLLTLIVIFILYIIGMPQLTERIDRNDKKLQDIKNFLYNEVVVNCKYEQVEM